MAMKVVCTLENLKNAIFNSERMVSKQNTLPILNNILIETEKGGLRLSATNLEVGVVTKIGAKVEQEGKITIPAKLLSNFINNLAIEEESTVILEADEQTLKIKSNKAKATIKGLSANDFPLIPQKNTDFLLTLPASKLKEVVLKIITCVSVNETRQELTGINVIFEEKKLLLAATDSFRLAEGKIELQEENINKEEYNNFVAKKGSIIIPASTLLELARISNNPEDEVKIAIEESQIFFEINGTRIISRIIIGKYPEYKHIMPKEFKTRGVGEKKIFQGSIRMASVFTVSKTGEVVLKIDAEANNCLVEAKSVEVGENTTEIKIDVTGPSQEVTFNAKYFLDGINTIGTTKIAILLNSNTSPVALKEINEKTGEVLEDYVYIVMPIKN
jgi:DNA polymerase-3 subunit beta